MGAWFNRCNNLNVTHVPYRGGGQAVADVVGGHIDMFYGGVAAAKGAIDCGSVKALAVTGDKRSSALPNVPTFKEAGVKEFDAGELDRAAGAQGDAGRHHLDAAEGNDRGPRRSQGARDLARKVSSEARPRT